MANEYTLGIYTFEKNPGEMDIPESKKIVAEVETYAGSAVFQWDAIIQGQSVVLKWNTMTSDMYNELRTLYIGTGEVDFIPHDGYTYHVIVTNLFAQYFKYYDSAIQYLKNVELTLNIRSVSAV